ncbi:hypothetical protein AVEN_12589-1 [Araneus ventricosus]|uniref:Uncharacterized protein n=1 Tax=Araneus ventricosus TaxID=182803 RepID=A0A4Y2AAS7_ARAVE|nr:hypothetical protein AVEN_12589-1 [Araneus ventricosus]
MGYHIKTSQKYELSKSDIYYLFKKCETTGSIENNKGRGSKPKTSIQEKARLRIDINYKLSKSDIYYLFKKCETTGSIDSNKGRDRKPNTSIQEKTR